MGLFAFGTPLDALAAALPDAAPEALLAGEVEPAAEADGFAEALDAAGLAATLPDAKALAGAELAAGALLGAVEAVASELAGADPAAGLLTVALPPQPSSVRTEAADATPPAMCRTRFIISRRVSQPDL
ncbi:MAG: hypothetical protein JOZ39_10330 [Chloroflexi bacterium]|nr:hypothetical protein [Chloroflexota bacterium]